MKRLVILASLSVTLLATSAFVESSGAAPATAPAEANEHLDGRSLGKVKIGAHEVEVFQDGKVEPGKEANFELKVSGEPAPIAIRGWIGIESGRGSVRTKAHDHDGEIHLHVEVPDHIPADAQLWVEVETESGRVRGSFKYLTD